MKKGFNKLSLSENG